MTPVMPTDVTAAAAAVWALQRAWRVAPRWTVALDARAALDMIARRHPHPLIRRAATCAPVGQAHQPLEAA